MVVDGAREDRYERFPGFCRRGYNKLFRDPRFLVVEDVLRELRPGEGGAKNVRA